MISQVFGAFCRLGKQSRGREGRGAPCLGKEGGEKVRVQKEFLPRIIIEVLIYAMSHIQNSSSSFIIKF